MKEKETEGERREIEGGERGRMKETSLLGEEGGRNKDRENKIRNKQREIKVRK